MRSERLVDVGKDAKSLLFHPANFPWLKNLSKAFDMYQWLRVVIEYKPVVGAMTDGATAVGFDWSTQDVKFADKDGKLHSVGVTPSRDAALACTPCFDTPVWQVKSLVLPADKLQQRLWYSLSMSENLAAVPGALVFASTKDAATGEIWVHYKVRLSGTKTV